MEQLEAQIAFQPEPVDWEYTDPSAGTTSHPGYENVLINPELLLQGDELEAHYAQAWDLYRNKMNSPNSIVAPMVEQSELPFRLLSRKYGLDITYTPMINSNPTFFSSASTLNRHFETCSEEAGSLTIQVCGANIQGLFKLGQKLDQITTNATDININLGCPQGIAKRGRYGSYLLEETIHVQRIVRSLKDILHVPITVKMRVLLNDPTYQRTLAYARVLQDSGASIITLHARTRMNKQDKIGQSGLEGLKMMKSTLKIPFFANGGVGSYFDMKRIQDYTKADGVMISEGLLGFPSLMSYPIRRSQLLAKEDRPPSDEGYYAGIHDAETAIDRQHYSYPLFDQPEIKDKPYHNLDEKFKLLPRLHPRSTLQELQFIDQYTGPDNSQIASELIYLTSQYSHHWQLSLRPHIFKIMHRELTCHTDLRMVYSMSATSHRMDFEVLQLMRHRDRYVWNKYKDHVINQLYAKLGKSLDTTPIAELDTTSLSDDDLSNILRDFDFSALGEHLDIYPWFSQEIEVRKQALKVEQDAADAAAAITAANTPKVIDMAPAATTKPSTQQDSAKEPASNHPRHNKEGLQNRLNKEQFRLDQQRRNAEFETSLKKQGDQNQAQQCSDANADDKCSENKIAESDQTGKNNKIIPQLLPTHLYPASTHPWVCNEDYRVLDMIEIIQKRGKQIKLSHRFTRDSWHKTYQQFCIDNGFLIPSGKEVELTLPHPYTGEPYVVSRPTYISTDLGYNPNQIIRDMTKLPTTADLIHNSTWTVRSFEDKQWARLFRLDQPNSVVSTKYPITTTPGQDNITPFPLDHFILPLPLESSWFFEKLYSSKPFWYFRYDHTTEVLHIPVSEVSIQDQLSSMLHARKTKVENLQHEKSGPSLEEQLRKKEQKLARKQQQRQFEIDKKQQNDAAVGTSSVFGTSTVRQSPPPSTPTQSDNLNEENQLDNQISQPTKRQRQTQ